MNTIADYKQLQEQIVKHAQAAALDKDWELVDWYHTVWEACNRIIKTKQQQEQEKRQQNLPTYSVTPVHIAAMLTVLRQRIFECFCEDNDQEWEVVNYFIKHVGPELLEKLDMEEIQIIYDEDDEEQE